MTEVARRPFLLGLGAALAGCAAQSATTQWTRLVEHAPFAPGYNFPVFNQLGRFLLLHGDGSAWSSGGGAAWTRTALPASGLNSAYLSYVQIGESLFALGRMTGNYQGFEIQPQVLRTSDGERWESLGRSETLPKRVMYSAIGFQGDLWIMGGFDGREHRNDIWRSRDGLAWTRVVETAPWSPRTGGKLVIFKDRLWLVGGGVIDGAIHDDVWSSADGLNWRREAASLAEPKPHGYAAVVHADRIWLVGANRAGGFSSGMLVSPDGRDWRAETAPWSPRGGVAAWSSGGKLYLTGGKYSEPVNGEPVFTYSNDVWRMDRV